jgi:hypothetical protein
MEKYLMNNRKKRLSDALAKKLAKQMRNHMHHHGITSLTKLSQESGVGYSKLRRIDKSLDKMSAIDNLADDVATFGGTLVVDIVDHYKGGASESS